MKDKAVVKKTVYLKSYGCQMNVRDSEVVAGLLKAAGYSLIDDEDKADVVIFNTCSVRQHAEDKVWSAIGHIAKSCRPKPKQKIKIVKPLIGLIGCMAQNYKEHVFERCADVDFVVGPSDIGKIPAVLEKLSKKRDPLFQVKVWETDGLIRPEEIYHTGFRDDKDHAYVVISEGCSNYCSYCVVPFVRGELHNRPKKEIIEEVEEALAKGITKISLLGQNVNAYKDGQADFIGLIKTIDRLPGLKEFTFLTSHPRDTTVELFQTMAECDKIKKNLHLPIQSGSDKILKSMNRGYTRKFYLDLVDNYRKIIKDGGLTTDIIVGFCGEKSEDFQDTFDLVREIGFDAAYIFKYSPRPNTEAWGWMDDVSQEEKELRHSRILKLQKEISKNKRR